MVEIVQGNLLVAKTEALVNTVNCIGYMGKGIALQFRKAFPENFGAYQKACKAGQVQPGKMFIFETGAMFGPKYIINFPTKRHWRSASKPEDLELGLKALVEEVRRKRIKSIAIPPLGCGLGGLKWSFVRPLIEQAFSKLPEVKALLFEPVGAPEPEEMPVHTEKPRMTPAKALFIKLMQQYSELSYRLSLLELQKLAYFLQESGEDLRLQYKAAFYGPYAPNLNKVLEVMEGHFIRGYGDNQKPDTEIQLLAEAPAEADAFIQTHEESLKRLERVASLIYGFETPYGMELLASAHWACVHAAHAAADAKSAIEIIHRWNQRKRRIFKPKHIEIAWNRLKEQSWI